MALLLPPVTSTIIFFNSKWVLGTPSFSIIRFRPIRSERRENMTHFYLSHLRMHENISKSITFIIPTSYNTAEHSLDKKMIISVYASSAHRPDNAWNYYHPFPGVSVTVAICILWDSLSYSPISPWSFRSNSAYLSAKQAHTGFIRGQRLYSSSAHMPQSCQHLNKHLSRDLETSVSLFLSWQLTGQKERQMMMADECVRVRENGIDFCRVLRLFLPKFILQQWLKRADMVYRGHSLKRCSPVTH